MHIRHPREDSEAIKYLPQNMAAIQIPEHDSCSAYPILLSRKCSGFYNVSF